jgi:hypothetical protein
VTCSPVVRIEKVRGSIPLSSTESSILRFDLRFCTQSNPFAHNTSERFFCWSGAVFGFYSRKVSCLLGLVLFRSGVPSAMAGGW